ncbi:hypothetical protein Oscil6304_5594 [Oscillatoria acuminata PCC 6304]|uniref:Uncharacterized protein n=1 Tax=Oscillatoria acuminata PCC 6304 TaxID=56110 RepID=K9TQE2_9CYAN|nr:hypothetical protein Oscil6304_5594 [Oscillatoria acuminata PCC 6304]
MMIRHCLILVCLLIFSYSLSLRPAQLFGLNSPGKLLWIEV